MPPAVKYRNCIDIWRHQIYSAFKNFIDGSKVLALKMLLLHQMFELGRLFRF